MVYSWRNIRKIFMIIIIVTLLITYGWPWATTQQIGSTDAILSIAFEGAGSGLDPQGNRFDINEVKSDEILSEAIQKSGLEGEVTAVELKRRIFILPQAEQDTLKELLTVSVISGKTQDIKERIIYPTSFRIGIKDIGIPSYLTDRKLLQNILKEYSRHLEVKYTADDSSEPAYSKEEILEMDYPEMIKVVNQNAESLLRYIGSYSNNEPQFVSRESGMSFGDIYEQALILKDNDITNIRSLVNYYHLTEDVPTRILYEETMLKRAAVVANKLQGAGWAAADIIQIYNNSSNYIIPSADTGFANLTPTENKYYSSLMDRLVKQQAAYIDAKYSQQDIANAIARLQSGALTGEGYLQVSSLIKSETRNALDRIDELRGLTKSMAKEFYETNVENKIGISGTKYHLYSYGNLLANFLLLAGVTALVMTLYYELKNSRYRAYLERTESYLRKNNKNKRNADLLEK